MRPFTGPPWVMQDTRPVQGYIPVASSLNMRRVFSALLLRYRHHFHYQDGSSSKSMSPGYGTSA